MSRVDLLVFRRVATAVMSLLVAVFLGAIVVGGWHAEAINDVTKWSAGAILLVGVVLGAMRSLKFASVPGLRTQGPLPVVVLVLFTGFIGGQGLEHTLLWLQPKVPVTTTEFSCSYAGRTERCSGEYTVDGREYSWIRMPVRSEPADGRVEVEVLRSSPEVVVTRGWTEILFWRLGGLVLLAATVVAMVRWIRLARTATAEIRRFSSTKVHSNGSNPSVR